MDKEYFDDKIDGCLATISQTLYNFSDEIVNLHAMVEHIRLAQEMQDKLEGQKS